MIRRTTWVLLAVFAVLVLGTLYLQRTGNLTAAATTTPSPTPEEPPLLQVQAGGISSLRITDAQGKVVALERDAQSGWKMTEPKAGTADGSKVDAAITPLETLQVLNKLEPAPAANVIGLDKPSYTLSLGLADGKQYTLQVGKVTPTGSGYYSSMDGGAAVVVSKSTIDTVIDLLNNPPFPPTATPAGSDTPGTPVGSETPGAAGATGTPGSSGASQTPEGTGVPGAASTATP